MLYGPNDGRINTDPDFWYREAKEAAVDAEVLFNAKRYRGALDNCHKALEKILKAFCALKGTLEEKDKTHNLIELAKKSGVYKSVDDRTRGIIDEVYALHFKTNYPDDMVDAELLEQFSYANVLYCRMLEVFEKFCIVYERYHEKDNSN